MVKREGVGGPPALRIAICVLVSALLATAQDGPPQRSQPSLGELFGPNPFASISNLFGPAPTVPANASQGAVDQPPIPPGALRRPGPGGDVGPTPVPTVAAVVPLATPAAPAVTAAAVAPVAGSLVTAQTPVVSVSPLPTSTLAQVPAAAEVDGTALVAGGDEGAVATPVSTVAALPVAVTPVSTVAALPVAVTPVSTAAALPAATTPVSTAAALPAAVTPLSTVADVRLPVSDGAAMAASVLVPVPAPVPTSAVTPTRYTGDMGARAPSAVASGVRLSSSALGPLAGGIVPDGAVANADLDEALTRPPVAGRPSLIRPVAVAPRAAMQTPAALQRVSSGASPAVPASVGSDFTANTAMGGIGPYDLNVGDYHAPTGMSKSMVTSVTLGVIFGTVTLTVVGLAAWAIWRQVASNPRRSPGSSPTAPLNGGHV